MGEPLYQRLAAILREQIVSGALPPGARMPSAQTLVWEHRVGVDTAKKALGVVRGEGLAFLGPDKVIRVGPVHQRATRRPDGRPAEVLTVPPHAVIRARMPIPSEREFFGLGATDVVPVLVVRLGDVEEVHLGDRTGLHWAE